MHAKSARAVVASILALCAPFLVSWRAADAQTWQWQVVVHNPNRAPMNSESRVELSGHDIVMSYAARLNDAEVPIASCRAQLPDVATARVLNSAGGHYLYVAFKPGHPAQCQSGNQPVALIPVSNDSAASEAVATINRACCGAAGPPVARTSPRTSAPPKTAVVARAAPSPTSVPTRQSTPQPVRTPQPKSPPPPASTPQPKSPAAPHLLITDWTESEGLFTFIRARNRGSAPVTISSGQVLDCRAVAVGCGAFGHPIVLAPGAAAVLATVMSADPVNDVAFSYRYEARGGAIQMTATGTSRKQRTGWRPPMSAQEVRSAQAAAIAALRTSDPASQPSGPVQPSAPAQPPAPLNAPARLTQRGSSRLAIGQAGQALVRVRVNAKGMPVNASIVSVSNPALVAAAIETAVSSSYTPAVHDGRPVDADYIATFQFDGQDPAMSQIPMWKRPDGPGATPVPAPGPT
jgi:hypothetical protein